MEERQTYKNKIFSWPVLAGISVLLILGIVEYGRGMNLSVRGNDKKPEIDFTWQPIGRVSLKDMSGKLVMKDDYALDFSTYNIHIVELNKDLDLPIEGMIGKEYEQKLSFAMFDGNTELLKHEQMTLQISISDDAGQKTTIERVVKLDVSDYEKMMIETLKGLQFE